MINKTISKQAGSSFSRNSCTSRILLVEDNRNTGIMRPVSGVSDNSHKPVEVCLHYIDENQPEIIAQKSCFTKLSGQKQKNQKVDIALALIDSIKPSPKEAMVVASSVYGCIQRFILGVQSRNFNFTVQIRPSTKVKLKSEGFGYINSKEVVAATLFNSNAEWFEYPILEHSSGKLISYSVADLASVILPDGTTSRLIAAQRGSILEISSNTIFALSSLWELDLKEVVEAVGWVRWIRTISRKKGRINKNVLDKTASVKQDKKSKEKYAGLVIRSNITLARQQDINLASNDEQSIWEKSDLRGNLGDSSNILNVVELFAGAGAMGLGFLMAAKQNKRYRIGFCGEVHPIYVETLKYNHSNFRKIFKATGINCVPEQTQPFDLRTKEAIEVTQKTCNELGNIHILIGGPPCQGFSNANRNSRSSENPHNQLVDTFFKYVERLKPRCFLMENVQGILWTPRAGQISNQINVVDWAMKRMRKAGYVIFPKLLDAAWYGVPQHRSRFFIFGIHKDLGYGKDNFGDWGPFPLPTHGPGTDKPYVTVRDAIQDLPAIGNGCHEYKMAYQQLQSEKFRINAFLAAMRKRASKDLITDHVTSRHGEYVIERYRKIPPGGNWQDIEEQLTNYTDVRRTHSNIYRRLEWDEPSITIGHYRKSMLIHPEQHRGLSLREASRLQSIPDWFRFVGSMNSIDGGLVHKQQQLANAVCPLLTKAIAEFIFNL